MRDSTPASSVRSNSTPALLSWASAMTASALPVLKFSGCQWKGPEQTKGSSGVRFSMAWPRITVSAASAVLPKAISARARTASGSGWSRRQSASTPGTFAIWAMSSVKRDRGRSSRFFGRLRPSRRKLCSSGATSSANSRVWLLRCCCADCAARSAIRSGGLSSGASSTRMCVVAVPWGELRADAGSATRRAAWTSSLTHWMVRFALSCGLKDG